jgi:hypothetical protein
MPQLALPATALVDLVVAIPSPGERPLIRRVRFEEGCLSDALPQAVSRACSDLLGKCPWIELGIEHMLQIIQVVPTVVVVAE